MAKKWYSSKTLWVNVIGIIAIMFQTQAGFVIDVAAQASILLVINLILRLVTTEGIEGFSEDKN